MKTTYLIITNKRSDRCGEELHGDTRDHDLE
jgi:hypothetical protein